MFQERYEHEISTSLRIKEREKVRLTPAVCMVPTWLYIWVSGDDNGEYVVRSFLSDGVFLPRDPGLYGDF